MGAKITRITILTIVLTFFTLAAGEQEDLFTACKQMDFAGVKQAVADGADVNGLDAGGHSPIALSFLSPDITRYLLDKGADPNSGKYPSLINACNSYSVEVVKMLLAAGADPNKKGIIDPSDTFRALIAAEEAKDEPNEAMIDAWSNLIGTQPTSEVTVLQQTVMQTNCVPALKLLIEHGVKIDIGGGTTVYHILASYSNTPQMRKSRFAQGAPMMARFGYKVPDWYSNIPDEINGSAAEMLDLLAGLGTDDINKAAKDGYTPLVTALKGLNLVGEDKESKLAVAKGLIKHGADPRQAAIWNYEDGEATFHPICTAAEYGDVELIKAMLEKGCDINTSTGTISLSQVASEAVSEGTWGGTGYTPLIISIMFNNLKTAAYLVDQGADLVIGSEGYAFVYFGHEEVDNKIRCLGEVEDKTPIYWALEKDDLGLVKKIADKIAGTPHPEFVFEVIAGASPDNTEGGKYNKFYDCPTGEEFELTPSAYGQRARFIEAAEYCAGLGL